MRILRLVAYCLLIALFAVTLLAELFAPYSYSTQFRESPSSPPSAQFPLGTDDLGRDRFSRLIYGSRVSLLLAPAAAFLSILVAALVGGIAGYFGGWCERLIISGIDLFLSLPWLFVLLTVRAVLPLNATPWTSVIITFGLLGLLGWAVPARVVRAGTRSLRQSEFVLQAKATGQKESRILRIQILPNLFPIFSAQFWVSVPAFILAEANLGLLGLGVSEPLPSWGNLLRELESYSALQTNPWLLSPLILLVLVVGCLQVVISNEESSL